MANVFVVEWTEKGQRIRQNVQFGNFDGDVADAQREIDKLWPFAYLQRTNVKVIGVHGSGEVVKVEIPTERAKK